MGNPWEMYQGVAARHEQVGACEACGGAEWLMVRTYLAHTSRYIEAEHAPACPRRPPDGPARGPGERPGPPGGSAPA